MKSILLSIQPYYVFLIIARLMGWDIPQHKTAEVRKDCPKDSAWNRRVHIYCSKNRKSYNRIPKQYQPLMKKFLGKVVGEFVCLRLEKFTVGSLRCDDIEKLSCLSYSEIKNYFYKPNELDGKTVKVGYGWHIDYLQIYDKPKELGEFKRQNPCNKSGSVDKLGCWEGGCTFQNLGECDGRYSILTHAPQSYYYVEELN